MHNITAVEVIGKGAYNTVWKCTYNGAIHALRIKKSKVNTEVFSLLTGLIASPVIYGDTWSVVPFLKPYNDNYITQYIELLIEILPKMHSSGYVYLDWKHDNVMVDGDKVVVSDIDFLTIESCKRGRLKLSHYLSDDLRRKARYGNYIVNVDNLIAVRDVLISLADIPYEITKYANNRTELCGPYLTDIEVADHELQKLYDKYNLNADNLTDSYTVGLLQQILNHMWHGSDIVSGHEEDIEPEPYEVIKLQLPKKIPV